jgi:hypothetical protein
MKMTFRHTFAGYRCSKCFETYDQYGGTSVTKLHLIVAFVFAAAFAFRLLRPPWELSWYYFFGIYAGELLLFFVSGFPLSFFKTTFHRCKKCNAPLLFCGRYFKYEEKPWTEDYIIFAIHAVLNVAIWLNLVKLLTS